MAKQVWQADNGSHYDKELEAVKSDARFWKIRAEIAEQKVEDLTKQLRGRQPESSYGSSGGGGHD